MKIESGGNHFWKQEGILPPLKDKSMYNKKVTK